MNTPHAATKSTGSAQLKCIGCGQRVSTAPADFRCSQCGDIFEVVYTGWPSVPQPGLDIASQINNWRQRRSSLLPQDASGVWRFRELLPVFGDYSHVVTLREGNTPLYDLRRAAKAVGVGQLFAKHQGMNPTGSFKDTGMTVAASVAKQLGYEWVACASTGNTSASMAAYASRAGLKSLVLIPEGKIAWGKLSQSLDYGALTCQLNTDFDGCLRVLNAVVRELPVYVLNSSNPYRLEGQKTVAVEIVEQLNWNVPDHVIVPGGNLGNSSAIGKMFVELKECGFIRKLPKISIIQAEGANPLFRTMAENDGTDLITVHAETRATAIRIGDPVSWKKAVSVLRATGGWCEQVSEHEIAESKAEIGAEGIGCEPASAVTLAGLKKLIRAGRIGSSDTVVLVLTGHVLKDAEYTLEFHRGELLCESASSAHRRPPVSVEAEPARVIRLLQDHEKSV